MEKRVFLAIFLSFIVLAGYQAFFAPPPDVTPMPGATNPAVSGATPAPATAQAGAAPLEAPQPAAPAGAQPIVADTANRDIEVDTDTVHAIFTTAGGALKSWRLKRYLDADGHPLELVPASMPPDLPRPFMISTDAAPMTATLRSALYQPSAGSLTLGSSAGTLSFEYRDASGLTARKTFHFQPEGKPYVVTVEATVDLAGASKPVVVHWGPGVGLGYKPDGSTFIPPQAIMMRTDKDKVERLVAKTVLQQPRQEGTFRFVGVEEQYFMSVALPGTQVVHLDYLPLTLPVPNDPKARSRNFMSYGVGQPGAASLGFYVGPKDFDLLRAVDPKLVLAIDFGIFSWLVVPLLQALKWLNTYLHNYGWSIIVLTIIINLIIFPLRHRSMVSMKKMQALQPEVKAIQERYAKYKVTDPERQKMNQEMMALYKQKGVNPASGCVPMLLTLPVLYAFYNLLYSSIELRGAPFMGWIHDLSLHDPFYVTPVIMGATMFLQQRMMPTTADPIQAKIFLLMPIVFTFTFLWAPSGLVLYWLMSNLLAIGQQALTNRIISTPGRPPARPIAARIANGAAKK